MVPRETAKEAWNWRNFEEFDCLQSHPQPYGQEARNPLARYCSVRFFDCLSYAPAPIDLTGYWVTIITQDWRWRMVTPAKGDCAGVPITAEGKRVADTWDPAKDEASGAACKSYGAPGLMHAPTRLHISWQDDNTLKVEADYGMQTRLLHFGKWKGGGPASLQGDSVAEWETPHTGRGRGDPEASSGRKDRVQPPPFGDLKVITNHLSGGYLRKNGVTRDTLKPGDRVVIVGNPSRTAEDRRARLVSITRPLDGWKWGGTFE